MLFVTSSSAPFGQSLQRRQIFGDPDDPSCDPFEEFCDDPCDQDICFTETETVITRTFRDNKPTTHTTDTPTASPTTPTSQPTTPPPPPPPPSSTAPSSPPSTMDANGQATTFITSSTSLDTSISPVSSRAAHVTDTIPTSSTGVVTITSISITTISGSVATATETFLRSIPTAQTSSSATTSSSSYPTPVQISASKGAAPPEIVAITAISVFFFALCLFSACYWSRKRARRRLEAENAVREFDNEDMVESSASCAKKLRQMIRPPSSKLPLFTIRPETTAPQILPTQQKFSLTWNMVTNPAVSLQTDEVPGLDSRMVVQRPDEDGVLPLRPDIRLDYWTMVMVPAYAADDEMLLPPPAYSRTP
ncbi:hypothetical protein C8T65DRAFT_785440 [Cerioporus squamosus]|nr:hypothetical protein C8T65DRAFT_785440 [Cerioporus squamosus]